MNQAQRHLTVMAFLDITLGEWLDVLGDMTDEELDALDRKHPEISSPMVAVIEALKIGANTKATDQEKYDAGKLYVQEIAQLNDDNLLKIVELITGRKPF